MKIKGFLTENIWNIGIWAIFLALGFPGLGTGFPWYLMRQYLTMVFLVMGLTLEMMGGVLDLSFMAEVAAGTCVGAALLAADIPLPVAVAAMVLFHVLSGLIRGYLIARLKINGVVITLALQIIWSNLFGIFTGDAAIFFYRSDVYANRRFWEIMAGLAAAVWLGGRFLLKRTYYGKYVRMMGEDLTAFVESGLDYVPIRMLLCAVSSLSFACGSVIILFITSAGSSKNGNHYLYPVLAAACLGGVNFFNGRGKWSGALLGTMSMVLFLQLMVALGLQSAYETAFVGLLIIAAILWNVLRDKS